MELNFRAIHNYNGAYNHQVAHVYKANKGSGRGQPEALSELKDGNSEVHLITACGPSTPGAFTRQDCTAAATVIAYLKINSYCCLSTQYATLFSGQDNFK